MCLCYILKVNVINFSKTFNGDCICKVWYCLWALYASVSLIERMDCTEVTLGRSWPRAISSSVLLAFFALSPDWYWSAIRSIHCQFSRQRTPIHLPLHTHTYILAHCINRCVRRFIHMRRTKHSIAFNKQHLRVRRIRELCFPSDVSCGSEIRSLPAALS